MQVSHTVLATCHRLATPNIDQRCVDIAHVGAGVTMAGVGPQLAHQLAVTSLLDHGHLPQGWTRGDVLEWSTVATVGQMVAQVGGAGVVAGPGARVLTGALVALATHGLGVAVCRLVATAHALPLPQPGVDLGEAGSLVGQLVPALHHEGVHPAGTVLGAGQQLTRPDHLDHLLVAVSIVRLKMRNTC